MKTNEVKLPDSHLGDTQTSSSCIFLFITSWATVHIHILDFVFCNVHQISCRGPCESVPCCRNIVSSIRPDLNMIHLNISRQVLGPLCSLFYCSKAFYITLFRCSLFYPVTLVIVSVLQFQEQLGQGCSPEESDTFQIQGQCDEVSKC